MPFGVVIIGGTGRPALAGAVQKRKARWCNCDCLVRGWLPAIGEQMRFSNIAEVAAARALDPENTAYVLWTRYLVPRTWISHGSHCAAWNGHYVFRTAAVPQDSEFHGPPCKRSNRRSQGLHFLLGVRGRPENDLDEDLRTPREPGLVSNQTP